MRSILALPLTHAWWLKGEMQGEYPTDLRRSCEEITESSLNVPQKDNVNFLLLCLDTIFHGWRKNECLTSIAEPPQQRMEFIDGWDFLIHPAKCAFIVVSLCHGNTCLVQIDWKHGNRLLGSSYLKVRCSSYLYSNASALQGTVLSPSSVISTYRHPHVVSQQIAEACGWFCDWGFVQQMFRSRGSWWPPLSPFGLESRTWSCHIYEKKYWTSLLFQNDFLLTLVLLS